jgi:hypothetical protein
MNPYLILGIVLFWGASLGGAGVYEYRNGVTVTKAAYEMQQIAVDQKSAILIADKDAKILEGGTQHGKDQIVIDRLAGELSDRLQIHIPTARCSVDTQVGTNTNGASGILSSGVDTSFARLQAGVSRLVERCDQLNVDAIASNTANR